MVEIAEMSCLTIACGIKNRTLIKSKYKYFSDVLRLSEQ